MRNALMSILACLLLALNGHALAEGNTNLLVAPREIAVHFNQKLNRPGLKVLTTRNPFWIHAQYWGECNSGYAVWVEDEKTHSQGLLFLKHGSFQEQALIGAGGDNLGQKRLEDLSWVELVSVLTRKQTEKCEVPSLRRSIEGEALGLSGDDQSLVIYWNGHKWALASGE